MSFSGVRIFQSPIIRSKSNVRLSHIKKDGRAVFDISWSRDTLSQNHILRPEFIHFGRTVRYEPHQNKTFDSCIALNFFLIRKIDRLYMRYLLVPNAREAGQLNAQIQRCVESGIYQFYKGMESFIVQLKKPFYGAQPSDAITMDHIWIYVYGFFLAIGLASVVFICEFLHFYSGNLLTFFGRGSDRVIMLPLKENKEISNRNTNNQKVTSDKSSALSTQHQ